MGHVRISEHPGHLADRIGFSDVGEEGVAHPLAGAGAAYDPRDVDEGDRRRHGPGRAEHLGQHLQTGFGHPHHPGIRLDRRKWIVRRQDVVPGERVEQGRLARVGKTHDANGESHDATA